MATLINNAGVQHYANKMVLAENRKVGSKSLPTALNDIDSALDEMKILFDTEYGSALDMKLDNNENIFSVGTGSGVDKKADVENSFTDVEIKGATLVNLFCSSTLNIQGHHNRLQCHNIENRNMYKEATYTFINLSDKPVRPNLYTKNPCVWQKVYIVPPNSKMLFKLESNQEITEVVWNFNEGWTENDVNYAKKSLLILEGDWTNKPIPQYFEGMKSVGEKEDGNGHKIEILSQSKNLFNKDDEWSICTYAGGRVSYEEPIFYTFEGNKVIVRGQSLNKDVLGYKCKIIDDRNIVLSLKSQNLGGILYYACYTEDWQCIKTQTTKTYEIVGDRYVCHLDETDIPQGTKYVLLGIGNAFASNYEMEDIMIEYGTKSTNYSPYQLNKKEISLNEPLRGLPNGVKDTIEKINGEWKIVRRCGEVVLDGNRTWTIWSNNTDGQNLTYNAHVYSADLDITKKTTSDSNLNVINDKVTNHYRSFIDRTGESLIVASSIIHLSILRTKLETQDTTGLKKWLSQNPIKVVYELVTPIIEDISPVTLQCWKNGTISIDEVLPVETTHTVALNKPAQIKRNIEELTALRKRVQALEYFYDQVALEQAHQLSLINHSIELDYDI